MQMAPRYMLVSNGEIKGTGGPSPSIAWHVRGELTLAESDAFWVHLGQEGGHDHFAAIRIGQAESSEAQAFRPAQQAGFFSLFQLKGAASFDMRCATRAVHMGAWLHRSRFCGVCGSACVFVGALNKCVCQNSACGCELFPRIEPAVVVLVVAGRHCLLARQPAFPKGFYGPIAGFVEPGETPEQAVSREVREETGLVIRHAAYHSAQAWPFPASLMLGFIAHADRDQQVLLSDELEEAIWLDRQSLADALHDPKSAALFVPPKGVIGRSLIDKWLLEGQA
ncbi:MAG: NAD(+) diphosphatase [Pseudomonadota bacterium]